MPAITPSELTDVVHGVIPIIGTMGIEVLEVGRTEAAVRLPIGPNGNHFGTAYAGSLFTAAEVLGGLFSYTSLRFEGAVPLVKQVTIDYLRPATTDVISRARLSEDEIARVLAETEANGKGDFELKAELTDADGTVVARTRGQYQLRVLTAAG